MKVNFRKDNKTGEIFAVILDTKVVDTYTCFCLYDGMHADMKKDYLKNNCKNLRAKEGYNLPKLCEFLKNRGYKDIEIKLRLS